MLIENKEIILEHSGYYISSKNILEQPERIVEELVEFLCFKDYDYSEPCNEHPDKPTILWWDNNFKIYGFNIEKLKDSDNPLFEAHISTSTKNDTFFSLKVKEIMKLNNPEILLEQSGKLLGNQPVVKLIVEYLKTQDFKCTESLTEDLKEENQINIWWDCKYKQYGFFCGLDTAFDTEFKGIEDCNNNWTLIDKFPDLNTKGITTEDIVNNIKTGIIRNKTEKVKSPNHYTWIPEVECDTVIKHFDCYPSNAIKYIWRHPFKNGVEDIEKAIENLQRYKKQLETDSEAIFESYKVKAEKLKR